MKQKGWKWDSWITNGTFVLQFANHCNSDNKVFVLCKDSCKNIAKNENVFDLIVYLDKNGGNVDICYSYKDNKFDETMSHDFMNNYATVFSNILEHWN